MVSTTIITSTIGFPRIGPNREMKKALESFWAGKSTQDELVQTAEQVERTAWQAQKDAGIALIGLDSTLYDQVLDFTNYLGLVPERFQSVEAGLPRYFAMARGVPGAPALDMQKYFDTNYHYLVPELTAPLSVKADWSALLAKVQRGQALLGAGSAVPILLGPVTLVALSRLPEGADAATLVSQLLPAYVELLGELKKLGVPEVQVMMGVFWLGWDARGLGNNTLIGRRQVFISGMAVLAHPAVATTLFISRKIPCIKRGSWAMTACAVHATKLTTETKR